MLHPVSRSLGILSLVAVFAATVVLTQMVYSDVDIDYVRPVILLGAALFLLMLTLGSLVATGAADRFGRFSPTGATGRRAKPAPSFAPVLGGAAVVLVGVGMALGWAYLFGGVLVGVFAGVIWLAGSWSQFPDQAEDFAPRVSDRLSIPFGLPLTAGVAMAVIVFSMSRILLALGGTGAVVVLSVASTLVVLGGVLAVLRPRLNRTLVAALVGLAVIAMVTLGIIGLALGEKEHEGGDEHALASQAVR